MKPSESKFDETAAMEMLREIREINMARGCGVEAKRYRAEHEDYRAVLDELEIRRMLRKEQGKYWVSLNGISRLDDIVSKELFDRFEKIFSILREQYKANLDASLLVTDLASMAQLSYESTVEALGYMVEIYCWGSRSNSFDDPLSAHISPSERILDYKTFKEFASEAQRDATRSAHHALSLVDSPAQSGELDQKSGILLSARQAGEDFPFWQSTLGPKNLPVAVAYLDVDKFKDLNTRFTNKIVDDTVLIDLQQHLVAMTTDRGKAYRHGGDEFIIILPNHSLEEGKAFCERLRLSFECLRFSIGSEKIGVTISVGLAVWPEHGANYDEILHQANEAQILAKRTRNAVEVARPKSSPKEPLPGFGLSLGAQRFAAFLNDRSESALSCDPILDASVVVEALGVPAEEVALAADELDQKGWVVLHKSMGMGAAGFSSISPDRRLFLATDFVLRGWNPEADARELAKKIAVKGDFQAAGSAELCEALGWSPRRLNPAADFLVYGDFAKSTGQVHGVPYVHNTLFCTPRTRRFATGG